MANSLITRCPKCSTAFRVSDEVLAMAKGKVRCGQCFHIFDTAKVAEQENTKQPQTKASKTTTPQATAPKVKEAPPTNQQSTATDKTAVNQSEAKKHTQGESNQAPLTTPEPITAESGLDPDDEIINPDWLQTLFDDEDLSPFEASQEPLLSESKSTKADTLKNTNKKPLQDTTQATTQTTVQKEDPAPWERELAEVEAALNAAPKKAASFKAKVAKDKSSDAAKLSSDITANRRPPAKSTDALSTPAATQKPKNEAVEEPDYMLALHSLAQTASAQARPSDIKSQHSILEQLSAQESLAPLFEENESKPNTKKTRTWLWFLGVIMGLALLSGQVATHYFDAGSRSPSLRPFYQMACSYLDCVLPGFEDIRAISIQHVRIQSHSTIPDTLLVNAIMTNVSGFSQPMPKIALEFFDLNGGPVAARLFAPRDYLHKDFLDITYMPPNTPIHLVIPIKDPGATAVTHQLNAFSADTRSY